MISDCFAEVTEALRNDHKLSGPGADTAQKLHRAHAMQNMANAVTQSVQDVVRNVLPKRMSNITVDGAAGVAKSVANNSSVFKETLKPVGDVVQNVASNLTKNAVHGDFMQKIAHNLTKTALDRTKFL